MGEEWKASGVPWIGVKRPGNYRFYPLALHAKSGAWVTSDGRAYRSLDGGIYRQGTLVALNKPGNRRKRHRAVVAARHAQTQERAEAALMRRLRLAFQ